jgi:hypothetical protein
MSASTDRRRIVYATEILRRASSAPDSLLTTSEILPLPNATNADRLSRRGVLTALERAGLLDSVSEGEGKKTRFAYAMSSGVLAEVREILGDDTGVALSRRVFAPSVSRSAAPPALEDALAGEEEPPDSVALPPDDAPDPLHALIETLAAQQGQFLAVLERMDARLAALEHAPAASASAPAAPPETPPALAALPKDVSILRELVTRCSNDVRKLERGVSAHIESSAKTVNSVTPWATFLAELFDAVDPRALAVFIAENAKSDAALARIRQRVLPSLIRSSKGGGQ